MRSSKNEINKLNLKLCLFTVLLYTASRDID